MIEAKAYFGRCLTWRARMVNQDKQQKSTMYYETYAAMDPDMLESEAELETPGAMEELGERYLFGVESVQVDVDKGLEWLQKAADAGHPDAMYMITEVYRTEQFGRKDLDRYFELLPKAASMGSWNAMYNLACACYKGGGAYEGHGYEADHRLALYWSVMGTKMMLDLLELFCTKPCSSRFQAYLERLTQCLLQTACAGAKQMMEGDGTERDVAAARSMLLDVQAALRRYDGRSRPQLERLLERCGAESEG